MKKVYILVAFILCLNSALLGADLKSVSLRVTIEPEDGLIKVIANLIVKVSKTEDVKFYLNSELTLKNVILGAAEDIDWQRDKLFVTVKNLTPGIRNLKFIYEGRPSKRSGIIIRKDLVSINDMTFWHPTLPFASFSYVTSINTPSPLTGLSCGYNAPRR